MAREEVPLSTLAPLAPLVLAERRAARNAPSRGRSWFARLAGVASILAVGSIGSSCNLDPVHRASVNNLGPENGDLYPTESEFHRPGEPCALCHSKLGPADNTFVLAGTVFWWGTPADPREDLDLRSYNTRVDKAYVRVIDANKTKKCFVTNCNGNFYVRPEQFPRITFPLLISVERAKDPGAKDEATLAIKRMTGHIGREPSCATCHIQGIYDFGSPGQIRLYDGEDLFKQSGAKIVNCPPPDDYVQLTLCPEDR